MSTAQTLANIQATLLLKVQNRSFASFFHFFLKRPVLSTSSSTASHSFNLLGRNGCSDPGFSSSRKPRSPGSNWHSLRPPMPPKTQVSSEAYFGRSVHPWGLSHLYSSYSSRLDASKLKPVSWWELANQSCLQMSLQYSPSSTWAGYVSTFFTAVLHSQFSTQSQKKSISWAMTSRNHAWWLHLSVSRGSHLPMQHCEWHDNWRGSADAALSWSAARPSPRNCWGVCNKHQLTFKIQLPLVQVVHGRWG